MQAKSGDKVKVHYVGSFTNGEVFDSSVARSEPLEFVLGAGQMIKGFENAVLGMNTEEKKSVTVPAEEAYGPVSEKNIVDIPAAEVPDNINPKEGDQLMLTDNQGNKIPVVVKEVTAESLKLDANHPMAGKDLVFEIQLLEILE